MKSKHPVNYFDDADDDYTLLGSRFARAISQHGAPRSVRSNRRPDWDDHPRGRGRPEPYRDRS